MTVYFINRCFHPDESATSQLLSDLAFHLASGGASVAVITSLPSTESAERRFPRFEVVRGVAVYRVARADARGPGLARRLLAVLPFYVCATCQVWRLARSGDVIVAATDPPLISVLAMAVARARKARLVNWLHDIFPEIAARLGVTAARGAPGVLLRFARDRSLRAADCNVALGERMAQFVAARGVARHRVRVIHNWADDEAIRPLAPLANTFTARHGLAGHFVVGYSGNLGRAHHFDAVLQAADALRGDSRVLFLVVGYGPQLASVQQGVAHRRLSNFRFLPHQPREELASSLAAAQLHLVTLAPQLEGLIVPSKFYGIAAAGRAVACVGDVRGEIARIVEEHDCGRAFAVDDGPGLARYIAMLADHPEEAARLGRNARAALKQRYSKTTALAAWEDVLAQAREGARTDVEWRKAG